MTEKDPKVKFGDLVADYSPTPAPETQLTDDSGEYLVAAWAKAMGLAPDEVIIEFRRNGPLSRLIRETFSILPHQPVDGFQLANAVISAIRKEGVRGERVHKLAKERLATKDATGKSVLPMNENSLATYEKIASQTRKRFAQEHPLASLFTPEDYVPPRSVLKPKNKKLKKT